MSRLAYVWSRWLVNGLLIGLSFLVGAGVAVLYTLLLLGRPDLGTVGLVALLALCYILLGFSWTFFFSSMTRGPGAAAGLSLIPFFLFPALGSLWKPLGTWGPYGGVEAALKALGGGMQGPAVPLSGQVIVPAGLDLALCVLLVFGAYAVLRKAEL